MTECKMMYDLAVVLVVKEATHLDSTIAAGGGLVAIPWQRGKITSGRRGGERGGRGRG